MEWFAFDNGASIGQRGSGNGVILRDDEHPFGARITLERDCGKIPCSVTCGIYGWMFHTRFLSTQQEAQYEQMQEDLDEILNMIPSETDHDVNKKIAQVSDAIEKFVEKYP